MNDRKIVSDFGEAILISPIDDPTIGEIWVGQPQNEFGSQSPRLVAAIRRGDVTVGGMAEAGWRYAGPWTRPT